MITSKKPVTTKNGDQVIVTTASGAEIWVPKSQFDVNADQIVYESHKAGDKYANRDGVETAYTKDGNKFVGCKKINKFELLDYMLKIGIQPSLS